MVLALLACARAAAQPPHWLTGPELERALGDTTTAAWSGTPLREGLQSFARLHRLALLIDRRVDPGRPLRMALAEQPLRTTCEALAAELGLGFTLVGPVGYLGPSATTHRLRTLVAIKTAEVQQAPPALRARLVQTAPLKWDDLATPRELVEQLARQGELRVEGLAQVPHDLWAAADLPPISWAQRLSLVLAQWDLTFRLDAPRGTLTLEPIPDVVQIQRQYAVVARPQEVVQRWRQLAPQAHIELVDGRIRVVGRIEDHERLMPASPPPPPQPPQPGLQASVGPAQQTHSLKVADVPLDKLLEALGKRLNLAIRLDRPAIQQAGISLDQLVSLEVQQVTTDALFTRLLTPLGLAYTRQGDTLDIFPKR